MSAIADAPETEHEHAAPRAARRPGDAIFQKTSLAAALTVIAFLAGVGIFLVLQGLPALDASGEEAYNNESVVDYVVPLLFGTVYSSVIAMVLVTPLAVGLGLVISHYAPRRLSRPVGFLVDLLAAVPSVVFGLWGITVLAPNLAPLYGWLEQNLGFIPLFAGPTAPTGRTLLTASVVLALMALPIVTAIMREVFAQTPLAHQEAALALGATRWEMIRMTVLPHGRSGMIAALLLGLGRALGETMAVAMVLSATPGLISVNIISSENSATIAASIAFNYANASGDKVNVLIFAGLCLFVLTFVVNFLGRWIASRGVVKG